MRANKFFWCVDKRVLRALVVLVFVACIAWGCRTAPTATPSFIIKHDILSKGWVQRIEGTFLPLADVQDFTPVPAGEPLVLETTLCEATEGLVLLFKSKHQAVRVYVDDVLVYECAMQQGFEFLKTPGNVWNKVPLQPEMQGATVRIELASKFAYYRNLLCDIYLVHENEQLNVQLGSMWARVFTGIFLLVIAVIFYIDGGLWHGTGTRKYVILMADFYMVLAFWVFANAGVFNLLFHRPIVSYLVEMLAVRLVPVMAYLFVRNIMHRYHCYMQVMGVVVFVHFFGSVALQFLFGVSFLSTLWVTHLLFVVGAFLNFSIILQHLYFTRNNQAERNYLFVCTGILFASALAEVWRYYALPGKSSLISVYIAIGYVLYTLVAYVVLAYRSAGLDRGKEVIETNYNQLKNTTLMRQINAHFFFNVLNGISALCKQDPTKADKAVSLLSKYMRHYMYFINTQYNINFDNELDLIRIYLTLEEMRFEDDFSAELDIRFTAFQLPPLTIQPIVENAVMHGLRQSRRGGKLTLRSKRDGNCAVITVQDNGAGFDVKKLVERESLALDNVRTRLATMANGTIEIQSQIGKGTTVTVTVPLPSHKQ